MWCTYVCITGYSRTVCYVLLATVGLYVVYCTYVLLATVGLYVVHIRMYYWLQ